MLYGDDDTAVRSVSSSTDRSCFLTTASSAHCCFAVVYRGCSSVGQRPGPSHALLCDRQTPANDALSCIASGNAWLQSIVEFLDAHKFGWILGYLKYWTLNLMPLTVYPEVLFGVDIHLYIQCLASGVELQTTCGGARRMAALGSSQILRRPAACPATTALTQGSPLARCSSTLQRAAPARRSCCVQPLSGGPLTVTAAFPGPMCQAFQRGHIPSMAERAAC